MNYYDTLSIIIDLLSYQDLCTALTVSKFWHRVGSDRLKIRHKTDPILPILHNRSIRADFIDKLHKMYHGYMSYLQISLSTLLDDINNSGSYLEGYDVAGYIAPYNVSCIGLIYNHILQNIKINKITDNYTDNMSHHTLYKYISQKSESPVFEKGLAIYMYLRGLLTNLNIARNAAGVYKHNKIYIRWSYELVKDIVL